MRVVSALMFFPRGGSAHVARALARGLPAHGCDVTVVSGSQPGGHGDARAFYRELDVVPVVFGEDAPLHPSYEDRPGAEDAVFGAVPDDAYEAHVDAWARALARARAPEADVLHLHHLTPIHEAAARLCPDVPRVGHLHGTELLFLEAVAEGAPWPHGAAWAERLRGWAQGCERLLVLARGQVERARELLGIDPARCVLLPNGFDPETFRPAPVDRAAFWPQHVGGAAPAGPVLTCVSRFTAVKRLPLLVRAWARAGLGGDDGAALVLVGGYPGEVEGEHPAAAIAASGARGVHLAGWHDHDALPAFLNASDAVVLASVREQFGAVLVEGMACGLPAIAVDRFGPGEIVEHGRTGWLVPPDDEAALAAALAEAVRDGDERARRGRAARETALARWSWPALAERLAVTLQDVARRDG